MPIPAQRKLLVVHEVVKNHKSVSEIAKKYGIPRRNVYRWLTLYNSTSKREKRIILEPRYLKGFRHPRSAGVRTISCIKRIIVTHPDWGVRRIEKELVKRGFSLSYVSIYQYLVRIGAHDTNSRLIYSKQFSGPGRLEPAIKLEVTQKILKGDSVNSISKEYDVPRRSLYRWVRQLDKAKKAGLVEQAVFQEAYVKGEKHPRAIYPKIESQLLSLVAQRPELSVHKLVNYIPASSWTLWSILNRHGLNYYQKRLAFSHTYQTAPEVVPTPFVDRIRSVFEQFIPSLAPAPPPGFKKLFKIFLTSSGTTLLFSLGIIYWIRLISTSGVNPVGIFFAGVALLTGSFFFLYSMKYYLTLALVLSFSQQETAEGQERETKRRKGLLNWILGLTNGHRPGDGSAPEGNGRLRPVGLEPNLEHIKLERHPFISVHIPFYNEKNVVERAILASTNFDYPDYEVILCDDSTDETTQIIQDYLKVNGDQCTVVRGEGYVLTTAEVRPGVILKHLHRTSRSGFKGGALKLALKLVDPRAEFVSVFDADFVPYPDTMELFMKYFQAEAGTLDFGKGDSKSNIAAVAGYQWHVLNKSENWITRGIRTEYSGSYVIERSGQEILGGMKLIHGSVYAIRRSVLEEVGWDTSITEDFELTLKLYEKGYKVVYTPYIQAPAECVSTLKRLIRQRMRWSEGHSFNVRKMFTRLMFNPKLTLAEKLEFLYLSPYYLQAFFFIVGTISWLISETLFPARLPFWTSLWGWSLVLTNMLSLPLMNAVGLFLEESEEKDYLGIASFIALSYIMVPFQAYASVKGFLEKEEGPWFRTPKTGRITDVFTRGRFFRLIAGILPGRANPNINPNLNTANLSESIRTYLDNLHSDGLGYLSLATANNRFNDFKITPKKVRWIGKIGISFVLMLTLLANSLIFLTPSVKAYDSNWLYRKRLTISGSTAGAQTNFQMEIDVFSGFGTDSGKNVYCSSHCNSDFSDVRFVKIDGTTDLDYWRQSYVSGTSAIFWVEVDSIPDSPSTVDIYMYYGYSSATTTSNGSKTFDFFDDFDNSSLGADWTFSQIGGASGSYSESGTVIRITNVTSGDLWGTADNFIFLSISGNYDNILVESYTSDWSSAHGSWTKAGGVHLRQSVDANSKNRIGSPVLNTSGYYGTNSYRLATGGSTSEEYPGATIPKWWRISRVGAASRAWYSTDGNSWAECGTEHSFTGGLTDPVRLGITLAELATNSAWVEVDWFRVRKYASPEPGYSSWATEEQVPEFTILLIPVALTVPYIIKYFEKRKKVMIYQKI